MTEQTITPVPVHITSASEGVLAGTQESRLHVQSVYRTFVLAPNIPLPVLAQDRSRLLATMIALGNSVVLCASQSQAQDPANAIGGVALGAAWANTPLNPQGSVLFVPVLAGAAGTSERWPVHSTEVVWAVSIAAAMLSVTIESKVTGY
jgi:hypothetical protein